MSGCDTTECYARWQEHNTDRDMQLERAIAAEMRLDQVKTLLAGWATTHDGPDKALALAVQRAIK